jgi:hypothetical protein
MDGSACRDHLGTLATNKTGKVKNDLKTYISLTVFKCIVYFDL